MSTKQLDKEIARVEKLFGEGCVMRLGDAQFKDVKTVSTGIIPLDYAINRNGGVPRGRMTELLGPPGGGKSTIAQQIIANVQQEGGTAGYVDSEHSLDATYAKSLGVNVDELLISQPDYGEQGLELCHAYVRGGIDVVVIDSIAALTPKAEIEGDFGDQFPGLQPRMIGQGMRKIIPDVQKFGTALIVVNQIRHKLPMGGPSYGPTETTPGGESVRHYASVRIDIRRIQAIKENDIVVGARTKAKIVKNKVGSPFREIEFDVIYGKGAPYENGLMDLATDKGIISKNGSWYDYAGERIGQGRDTVIEFLKKNKEICHKIKVELGETL